MKTIARKTGQFFTLIFFCLLAGISTYAQEGADSLTSADYHITMPKHYSPMYNGPLRFIIMGIVIAGILFVTYRYWKQASMGKDIWHDPQ